MTRIEQIKKDPIQLLTLLSTCLLFICHLFQFIDSNYMVQPLIRMIFCCIYIPLLFIAGRKIIAAFYYVLSITIIFLDGNFLNYTSAWIMCMCIMLARKKFRPVMLTGHAMAIIIVCTMHNKTAIHLAIYFLNCALLYSASFIIYSKVNIPNLKLTDDEEFILNELRSGKQQKEISKFSVNTITKKLRDAKTRNNIATTEELLCKYIQSHS